jgi:CubicO group peptidase (beta-lactamase class C family)
VSQCDVDAGKVKIMIDRARSVACHALRGIGHELCVLMLACGPLQLSSAKTLVLPAPTAARLAVEWMGLCRSQNVAQMTKWLTASLSDDAKKRVSVTDRARADIAHCALNGGFRTMEVIQPNADAVLVRSVGLKTGIWFKQTFIINGAGKLDRAGTSPYAPVESALPTDLSDAAIANEAKATVAELWRTGLFSGIVTVSRGTRTIVSASGGFANRDRKTPITGSTQFTLGSMGKMFTAVSVGQLVDQEKMSFDDTVGKFFPEYPNAVVRDNVTVGMLLSHTAGMGDFLAKRTPDMMKKGVERATQFMPLYDQDELQFAPGTNWAYSNAGLALAGAIVEKVSGEDYPAYIRKHIFAAAGMTNSDPNNVPHTNTTLVTPYTRQTDLGPGSDWQPAEHDVGSPAGGAISTADDLLRFADALRIGKLVSKKTFEEMTKPRGNPPGMKYGYAMDIDEIYGRTIVGHAGGFPGVSTHLYLLLDSPYSVVVLANQDPPAEAYVGSRLVALMAEKAKLGK